ncbi:neuronal acetylcholine receptor subunit alpha-7 isoform X6 [Lepeophtheirus salmonis]|uniref:neuronal acetylcholine receptor subunit alpha-7 isoform X6 n=1 Tax=Lepeophtheirus salmonis TaxID=72036 RepID=UPI001AE83260|nr:neuronal acetylcholine receptor subunit alpha-7-like isoform X6 [Lepeophtheirus salmonis]
MRNIDLSCWSCYLLFFLSTTLPISVYGGPHERRLLNDLLAIYNNLERPVFNESEPLKLSFGLTLQQIIDVQWEDVNMRWNKSEYGGVEDIRIPPAKLWKPDVLMYNSADEAFDGTYPTNVVVSHTGSCTYIPPGIFKSTCKIDITWFPFDDQDCEMKFGSWTYNGFKLDLQTQNDEGVTSTYVLNGEWALLGVPGKRNEVFYDCCPEPYLDVTFVIKIRRRTLYYFFNLIVPCVLIASMAVLGFTLPPDSGEKLSLGVTILLSLTVFLNMVSATMPVTSDNPLLGVTIMLSITIFATIVGEMLPVSDATPLIGTYFNCIMFMVASSVVTTIMILNYHHRLADTHEMPNWVRCVFLQWIPWVLRMGRPGEKITRKTILMQNKMKELDLKERSSKSLLANVLDMDDDFRPASTLPHIHPHHPSHSLAGGSGTGSTANSSTKSGFRVTPGLHQPPPPPPPPPLGNSTGDVTLGDGMTSGIPPGIHRELSLILKEIRVITDKIREDEDTAAIENDWKFAAMVLDRLCLITFTMFTIIATVAVLFSAPHIIVT